MRSDFSLKTKTMSFEENLNASRPSEPPPFKGENVRTFWCDHRLQIYKTSSWHSNGFPDDGSNSGSTV